MLLSLTVSLACATAACNAAQTSETPETSVAPEATETAEALTAPEVSAASEAPAEPTPAKLVAFDGAHDFMKTSRRLRVWRKAVDFDVTVDTEGHASDCEVVDRFRKTYVNNQLCDIVMAHHTFEPARNAQNEPVEGSYRAHISYADLREELD